MNDIKIINVLIHNRKKDLLVSGNKIVKIGINLKEKAKKEINGKNLAAISGFYNLHTHLAMTLFRGLDKDMPVDAWLKKVIWPREMSLTRKKVEQGSTIGVKEMKKSGTFGFCDMYWYPEVTAKVVMENKMSAIIGVAFIDLPGVPKFFAQKYVSRFFERVKRIIKDYPYIKIAMAPHAIYTVKEENLIWAKKFAKVNNLLFHIHLAETKKEVFDCRKKTGLSPVEYLDKLGILDQKTILAHCLHLSDDDIKILSRRKPFVVYCPTSNMKLASGEGEVFPFHKLKEAKVPITLGTDGPVSNNSLNMIFEMKIAALLQKHHSKKADVITAKDVYQTAINGAKAFGFDNEIKEGKEANFLLLDTSEEEFFGGKDIISHLVYSAHPENIKYSIFQGQILHSRI